MATAGAWAGDGLGVFTQFACSYDVPPVPGSYDGQSIFVWCAVEPARSERYEMGVMQPEIDYGPNCMPGR
eukprot:gene7293-1089_t